MSWLAEHPNEKRLYTIYLNIYFKHTILSSEIHGRKGNRTGM
ncbi:MAG: hypothetical protein BAJALOKI2v1_610033 [Promethearchaeota archaeon]|nr:MAG: hypothetical protein BAJALOKI2v1_610033 [Candidatus Lokiarchaeota archaeon]